jgi:hypothetical protein
VADRQTRVAFISSGREQISAVAARLDECEKYANLCVCMRARDKTRELCVRRMAEEQSRAVCLRRLYTHTHTRKYYALRLAVAAGDVWCAKMI